MAAQWAKQDEPARKGTLQVTRLSSGSTLRPRIAGVEDEVSSCVERDERLVDKINRLRRNTIGNLKILSRIMKKSRLMTYKRSIANVAKLAGNAAIGFVSSAGVVRLRKKPSRVGGHGRGNHGEDDGKAKGLHVVDGRLCICMVFVFVLDCWSAGCPRVCFRAFRRGT